MVALEVTGAYIGGERRPATVTLRARATRTAPEPSRAAYFGPERGLHSVAVLERDALSGTPRAGPFIVEEYDATTVVPPDAAAHLDAAGNIVLDITF